MQDSIVDVNYNTARKIQKEIENFYYDMITKRMSAEAAKEQAAAMVDKIAKDYELGKGHLSNEDQKNLREWLYVGVDLMSEIIESVSKFKQAQSLLKRLEKVIGSRKLIRLTPEELEAMIVAAMPSTIKKSTLAPYKLNSCQVTPTNSVVDPVTVYLQEYKRETYELPPNALMIRVNYNINSAYNTACFNLCDC